MAMLCLPGVQGVHVEVCMVNNPVKDIKAELDGLLASEIIAQWMWEKCCEMLTYEWVIYASEPCAARAARCL